MLDCLKGVQPYLIEIDDWLPIRVLHLVEVPHADFTEVSRMVLVQVGAVVVLATGHTTTTGMLSVLAHSSMASGDVTAAVGDVLAISNSAMRPLMKRVCRGRGAPAFAFEMGMNDKHTVSAFLSLW